MLRQLRSEFGDVSILLAELESNELLPAVRDQELDVVFTRSEAGYPVIRSLKILDERVVAAPPTGHPLAGMDSAAARPVRREAGDARTT